MQNPANNSLPANSGGNQSIQPVLSAIRIIGIVILGGYSGMWTHRFFNPELQGYNESPTQAGKPPLEKTANSQSEYVKKAHKEESAKQAAEILPDVIATTLTSADNEHTVADDLKQFNVSGIIVHFMDSPYLTFQGEIDKQSDRF